MNLKVETDVRDAAELEKQGLLEEAVKMYENAIRSKPLDGHPYNRLMILYRKLQRPRDELRVIKRAVSVFEAHFKRKSGSRKLTELSNAMMQLTGLTDKNGKSTYHPEPINKWMKRKKIVEKNWRKPRLSIVQVG